MSEGITRAEFARDMGVNRATVTRWIQRERITPLPNGRIDPQRARAQLADSESVEPHHQARKAQIEADKAAQAAQSTQAPSGDMHSVSEQLKRETLRLQAAKARKAALEAEQLAGNLVDRADVDYLMAQIGATARGLLEGLADRNAGEIAAAGGDLNAIHKKLDDLGRELAAELADAMGRLAHKTSQAA